MSFQRRQSNSWHWLALALVVSSLAVLWPFLLLHEYMEEEHAPVIEAQDSYLVSLEALDPVDVTILIKKAETWEKKLAQVKKAASERGGQPIPKGEASVQATMNTINEHLARYDLQQVERELSPRNAIAFRLDTSSPDAAKQLARQVTQQNRAVENWPYTTREIRYVVEGPFPQMFRFLAKQSFLKPPYHITNIALRHIPGKGMRMSFSVLVHYS